MRVDTALFLMKKNHIKRSQTITNIYAATAITMDIAMATTTTEIVTVAGRTGEDGLLSQLS